VLGEFGRLRAVLMSVFGLTVLRRRLHDLPVIASMVIASPGHRRSWPLMPLDATPDGPLAQTPKSLAVG